MISKLLPAGALALGAVTAMTAAVRADDINTSGVVCQHFNAAQATDIDYLTNGVRNINAAARPVICAVPRLPTSGIFPTLDVAGHNNANTSTSCTATLYSSSGTFLGSQSFTQSGGASGANWNVGVTITPTPTFFDYISVLCTLPGNGGGVLYGVTAIQ